MEENMHALMERLNSSSQFLQSNDMRVTEVRHGFAKVEMIIDEQILNIHGFVHGGAYSLWQIQSLEQQALRQEEIALHLQVQSIILSLVVVAN